MQGVDQSPETELRQAKEVLRWSNRKHGPDSTFSIRAMNDVAEQLARQDRRPEEAIVLEQMVAAIRNTLGPDHDSSLSAELKLAICLLGLDRAGEAEPLLTDVVAGRARSAGAGDASTLAAMAWRATAARQLGKLGEARAIQEAGSRRTRIGRSRRDASRAVGGAQSRRDARGPGRGRRGRPTGSPRPRNPNPHAWAGRPKDLGDAEDACGTAPPVGRGRRRARSSDGTRRAPDAGLRGRCRRDRSGSRVPHRDPTRGKGWIGTERDERAPAKEAERVVAAPVSVEKVRIAEQRQSSRSPRGGRREEALGLVAAVVGEEVELFGGFDPDADAVQPKVLGERDDRKRDRAVLGARR